MTERELFQQVHDEILDYVDDELILRCANWGYEVSQTLLKHDKYLVQSEAEHASAFMYAVVTAVMIGEFAERAFNDHNFEDDLIIDLGLFDIDFEQIKGFIFIREDIAQERIKLLRDTNSVELRDMRASIHEWIQDTYSALKEIYKKEGVKDPDYRIFISLLNIYEGTDEGGNFYRSMTDKQKHQAYEFVSGGFGG